MSLWSRAVERIVRKTVNSSLDDWFREFGERRPASGIAVNQTTAMRVATVMACVRLRSQDVAKLPPRMFRMDRSGKKTEALNHPLTRLFRQPNPWQTWFEFVEQMQMALLLRGNAYAAVEYNPAGDPIALIPINPDRVWLYEAVGGDIFYQVSRGTPFEVAALNAFPLRIPADDIFHLRFASSNTLLGLSPIALAAETISLASAQELVSANLMGRGARPTGILTTDKRLSEKTLKRQKTQWQALYGGVTSEQSGGTAVLEEGLKWQALTFTSVDLEFIASRKLQVDELCRVFGVSPVKVGVLEGGVGRAFEQIQLAHYTDCVHPDLVRWEQKLQSYFRLQPNEKVSFDETELLRSDLAARANAARVLQVSGITTPNESRASFGLNPYVDGGDKLYLPNNVVPIEMAGTVQGPGPGSDQSGSPAAGGSGDPAGLQPGDLPGADGPAPSKTALVTE